MVIEQIKNFIFNSNINVLYSIIATLIISLIIAIIRKTKKTFITLVIIFAIVIMATIFIDSFNEKYNLRIKENNIFITIEDKTYNISDFENINNIDFKEDEKTKKTLITIDYKKEDDVTFEMPSFMSYRLKELIQEKTQYMEIINNE